MALSITQRQVFRTAFNAIHNPPTATDQVKASKYNQVEKNKMVKELTPFIIYLYKKYMDAKITESAGDFVTLVFENINIPISIGDTLLGGKFKNKRIVVKSISKNEKGDITINGKPLLKFRLIDEMFQNPTYKDANPKPASPTIFRSPVDIENELEEAQAVSGGKVHKYITGKNLTLKGKKYPDIEFEVLGIDNKLQLVKLKVLAPKSVFGQEMNVQFSTIRRGPFIKTDTAAKLKEDLRKWFGKGKTGSSGGGGWDRYGSDGQKLGKCGDGDEGDAYAACLSKEKAAKLGPKGRAAFVRRKRADQKKAGDAKKGGEQKKGQKPTFSKTGASEGVINEKQLKGLDGISPNQTLDKISKVQKLKIIKEPGNIIDFIVPDWAKSKYKVWQVIGTGKIKKNISGDFFLEGKGPIKSSPAFKTMDDLIDGVDWKSMEQTRRFNEGSNNSKFIDEIYYDSSGNPCKYPTTLDGRCLDKYHPSSTMREPLSEMPMGDLQKIDQFADKQLNPIDVVLTDKHFFDRLNDPRNDKEISQAELIGFFKRLGKNKKQFLDFLDKYKEVVAVDDRTNINIPFMKQTNKAIAKTIMRKKDFKSSTPKLDI